MILNFNESTSGEFKPSMEIKVTVVSIRNYISKFLNEFDHAMKELLPCLLHAYDIISLVLVSVPSKLTESSSTIQTTM